MREPTIFEYISIVLCCFLFAIVGLYLLANFSKLFRGKIRNEFVRTNVAAWLVIFFLSSAITPMGGGFFYTLEKFGWIGTIIIEIISTLINTLVVFNAVRFVALHPKLKTLPFIRHMVWILATLIISMIAITIPMIYVLFGEEKNYMSTSSIR